MTTEHHPVHVVNLRGWPGLDDWQRPTTPPPYTDRLGDRMGLVLFSAAERGALPERFGLGVYLEVVGRSVVGGGIIVPDQMAPDRLQEIAQWALGHHLATTTGPRAWSVVTVSQFYDPREGTFALRTYCGAGWCIGANLGRTLALPAEHCGARLGTNADSWELWLPGWGTRHQRGRWKKRSPHRPPLWATARRVGWQVTFAPCGTDRHGKPAGKRVGGRLWRGAFLDLVSLAYALDGDRSASFAEHCADLGLSPTDLAVALTLDAEGARDVADTVTALHALAVTLDEHAGRWFTTARDRAEVRGRLDLARTVSPGAVAAQALSRSRVRPPIETFDLSEREHDAWAQSFHGGWCEADPRIMGTPFPAVLADVRSCFPLVAHLLGWWDLLCAETIDRQVVTAKLRRLCEQAAKEPTVVLDPAIWRSFGATLVEVVPDGEPFPIEVEDPHRPDGRMEVVPVLSPDRPLFIPWSDVVGAAVRCGRVPRIIRATRHAPVGRQAGLPRRLPVLPGLVLDLVTDPALALVAHRRKAKERGDALLAAELRTVVNSLVYGILSRFDEVRRRQRRQWELGERPGPWNCLPLASSVTAGSRLLLATFDRLVTDRGSFVAYRDTDSSLVPASPDGDEFLPGGRVLSWDEVDEIVDAFAFLSPAPWWPVWSVKRVNDDHPMQAVVFAPKRHAEFTVDQEGSIRVVQRTDSQLGGTYADPPGLEGRAADGHRAWSLVAAEREVRYALARADHPRQALRCPAPWDGPVQESVPALRRLVVKTPETARQLPAALGVRPGTPYLQPQLDDGTHGPAPVTLDPGGTVADWKQLLWFQEKADSAVVVTTDPAPCRSSVLAESLDHRALRWSRPSPTRLISLVTVDPLLIRRPGRVSGVIDADVDGLDDLEGRRPLHVDADRQAAIHAVARQLGKRAFGRLGGLSPTVAERAASGQPISERNVERALRSLAAAGALPTCAADGCGEPVLRAGARYHEPGCRKREGDRRYRERRRSLTDRSEDGL